MKNCNEILAKIYLGVLRLKLAEKCNAALAKTQKGGEKLTEKCKAVFVFYFAGFHLNLTENATKILEKTVSLWTLKTNFCRYSWLDPYQQLVCLKRQDCCNASDWIGLR